MQHKRGNGQKGQRLWLNQKKSHVGAWDKGGMRHSKGQEGQGYLTGKESVTHALIFRVSWMTQNRIASTHARVFG
jgi:hypothetical protein